MDKSDILQLFKANHFRATPQRIAIYDYLYNNRTHPDADEIYRSVSKDNPVFSKTTVYNSLDAMVKTGLVISINIDSGKVRYDVNNTFHGHFICKKCKKIYDFKVDDIVSTGISNFDVQSKDVYYSGLCPECK